MRDRAESAGSSAGFFWMDSRRATVLVTLHDRMDQAEALVKSCWSALQQVFTVLDPLREVPTSIFALVDFFRQSRGDVQLFAWHQLVAGAVTALAVVRVLCPGVDLERVGHGPQFRRGGQPPQLAAYYRAAQGPAEALINAMMRATTKEAGH